MMESRKEIKIGNDINKPKSKNMLGINSKKTLSKKIKQQKEKQRKLLQIVKDEIRKAEQFRISLEGLEKLSPSSINSLQIKREKAFNKAKDALNNLITNTKIMKNTEKQFRKVL